MRITEFDRRRFLQATGLAALGGTLAACGGGGEEPPGGVVEPTRAAPEGTFTDPAAPLSGALSILMWSHFVPAHDTWFDPWAREWGSRVGVEVTVDHINYAELPARTQAEIQAGQGHDLILHIAPVPQYEPSVLDLTDVVTEADSRHGSQLDLCRKSSFNPTTRKFFAFTPDAGCPTPATTAPACGRRSACRTARARGTTCCAAAPRSRAARASSSGSGCRRRSTRTWRAGRCCGRTARRSRTQTEQVVINSPEAVEAVEFMSRLYRDAMTPEVFSWNAASNNQGLAAGQLSFILNSISAWRTSQETDPEVANDICVHARRCAVPRTPARPATSCTTGSSRATPPTRTRRRSSCCTTPATSTSSRGSPGSTTSRPTRTWCPTSTRG